MSKNKGKTVVATPPKSAVPPPVQAAPVPAAGGSLLNGFLLFLISMACVFVVYKLNESFFEARISAYWEAYGEQKDELDPERRKLERWGGTYYYSKAITGYFEQKGAVKTALVLLPPSDYFTANGMDYYVPEPAIFYYMTGLKTLWPNHRDGVKAAWSVKKESSKPNWYVHAAGGQLMIDSVQSPQQLDSILTAFNQYKTRL